MTETVVSYSCQLQLKKWVLREALKDWMEPLPLVPQGNAFQRDGAIYLKARWLYHFVLEALGLGTSRRDLKPNLRGWGGCRNEGSRRSRKSISMNRQVCGRKNFMVDAAMNRQPVKLSENGRDVISFPTFCDSSRCCILCCLYTLNLCLGQASKESPALKEFVRQQ